MTLSACIADLAAQGKLGSRQRERAQEAFDRQYRRLTHEMSPEAAAAQASEFALGELDRETKIKKRQTFLQAAAQSRMMSDMGRYGGDQFGAAKAILGADAKAPFINVEAQQKAVLGRAHAKMEAILERHSRNIVGETRNKAELDDLVREAFGEKANSPAAKELNEAWQETAEMLRQRFNRAGGAVQKRADWGMPQSHDMLKLRETGFEAWREFTMPKLDLDRMIDDRTGLPFTAEDLSKSLRDVFETITSDGWNTRGMGTSRTGKLANRRTDPRFLVFKSADDWIGYEEKFGTGNAFEAMMGHIDGMSRDIALMETLGPNPKASLRWLQDHVRQEAATGEFTGSGMLDKGRSAEKALGDLYDVVSGQLNSPVNEVWARRMGGIRSALTSALLGSAQISAITDVGFQAVTRAYNGLPVTAAMTDYLKLLNPANKADRRIAVSLGLMADEASKRAAALGRYIDGDITPGVAGRLADGVIRASGLSAWTQAGKWAYGMATLSELAAVRGKGWAALSPPLRDMMQRYGIEADAWNKIRSTEPYRYEGGEWLRPDDIEDQAIGDAMLRMVLTETDYAVPSVTARARATLSFGQRPGTLGGEIIKSAAMFKSFGVSLILTHGSRMMAETGWNRAKYFAGLTITTTLLGALAMQAKEIAKGREPKDMNSPEFWGQAVLQGGGLGIFGDFVAASENRYGSGLAETMAGPVVGAATDIIQAGVAVGGDLLDPERVANIGKEVNDLLSRYTPGSSLWYLRTAFDRVVLDQIQQTIDPEYSESWQRMEDRAADQNQAFWWRPGEATPELMTQP